MQRLAVGLLERGAVGGVEVLALELEVERLDAGFDLLDEEQIRLLDPGVVRVTALGDVPPAAVLVDGGRKLRRPPRDGARPPAGSSASS